MPQRMLWVTDDVPDADLGGGNMRQYYLMRALADQIELDLLLVGELTHAGLRRSLGNVVELERPPEPDPPARWRRRIEDVLPTSRGRTPFGMRAAGSRTVLAAHIGDTSRYDIVQIEHPWLSPLLPARRNNQWIIDLMYLMSVQSRQLASVSDKRRVKWLFERDARRSERVERSIVESYDLTIVPSEDDASTLGPSVAVIPNGVDINRFKFTPLPSSPRLIFSASFNYDPNADAALWFCHQVFPQIRQLVPDAVLLLVGRNPDDRIRALTAIPGVEGHFNVPSVTPYLESARIAVVPVRMGSGTRLKALEAMAAGRAVVGTTAGLEGLELRDGESAAIADQPELLVRHVVDLCTDDERAQRLVEAARRLVEQRFSWDRVAPLYVERVLALATGAVTSPLTARGR